MSLFVFHPLYAKFEESFEKNTRRTKCIAPDVQH